MKTITGTSHFVSIAAAMRYYAPFIAPDAVIRKITSGEIAIGRPALKPKQSLGIIAGEGRYSITEG
jgi:hypothetical protein